jgi:flagellar basal-body rod protein FlgB
MEIMDLVEKALGVRAYYHKVLAANIANVETPNYKEKDIDFGKTLESRMKGSLDTRIEEKTEYDGINSADGNTVNMENQIVRVTENNLYYNSLVRVISKKFAAMRYVINEGKG